jgi:NAD(P)-dependent dehydrogenase (short-subunit alcohol dehydrogenase family)
MDFFAGKRALIVGGSRGIGRALAGLLAGRGARVCVAARGAGDLDRVVAELTPVAAGPHVREVLDVTDAAAVARARAGVLAGLGGLDVLVCVCGFARAGGVFDTPAEDYRRMLDVNYLGHVNVVRSFGPELVARRGSTICIISSLAAIMPIYGYAAYAASKAAVAAFAEALRQELKLAGVRVVIHYPPTTDTPGLAEQSPYGGERGGVDRGGHRAGAAAGIDGVRQPPPHDVHTAGTGILPAHDRRRGQQGGGGLRPEVIHSGPWRADA